MKSLKLIIAEVLAIIAVSLAVATNSGLSEMLGIQQRITGFLGFLLAIAAFAVAVKQKSAIISGALLLQGVVGVIASYLAGVAIGYITFGIVLVLGVLKSYITWSS